MRLLLKPVSKLLPLLMLFAAVIVSPASADAPRQTVILVLGAPGSEQFAETHRQWSHAWQQAAEAGAAKVITIGDDDDVADSDRGRLARILNEQQEGTLDVLWLVLIGHGTYDGQAAKFNLRGPDLTASELAEQLAALTTPTVVINCASSSGPFINELSAPNRIVVTATKSGYELNYARFGEYLAGAINDADADLDKDGQTSLLEAYLTACRRLQEFYDEDARLMTEHALLDDNGDGRGTPAEWFRGIRAVRRAVDEAELDGLRAHQTHLVASDREAQLPHEVRQQRDQLELQIAALRKQKSELPVDEYYAQLEQLLLPLARLYEGAATGE
ncbi:hypothetical protein OAS39_11325 [Pirellulales bacterium]|nr:hypothetical protein [Pirellulales bacterium]